VAAVSDCCIEEHYPEGMFTELLEERQRFWHS
jgi:hypothetical protein